QQPQTTILSNEQTVTRWANPAYLGTIYAGPSPSARHVGRLHMDTEDGFPEVYVLLKEHVNATGNHWILLRIPGRPNGQTGWVRRTELRRFGTSHWLLVVNRRAEQLTAYDNGRG